MAQAFWEMTGGPARSAGSAPAAHVHPEVVTVMREVGVDLADRVPHGLTVEDAEWADIVVTMGCGDACPFIPGKRYLDWELSDPHGQGLDAVRVIRDQIRRLIDELAASLSGGRRHTGVTRTARAASGGISTTAAPSIRTRKQPTECSAPEHLDRHIRHEPSLPEIAKQRRVLVANPADGRRCHLREAPTGGPSRPRTPPHPTSGSDRRAGRARDDPSASAMRASSSSDRWCSRISAS